MLTFPVDDAPIAINTMLTPSQTITIYGTTAYKIGLRLTAEAVCDGMVSVIYICGDNRFDPYVIARLAKLRRCRQEKVLNNILVARAFTGYQFVELLHRLNPKEISGPVIISGICSAFLDEDMTNNDAAKYYYRTINQVKYLANQNTALLITESGDVKSSRRGYFLKELFRVSNCIYKAEENVTKTLETQKSATMQPQLPFIKGVKG